MSIDLPTPPILLGRDIFNERTGLIRGWIVMVLALFEMTSD